MRNFILLFLSICSVTASAQTIFRSGTSGEWSTGANWEISTNGGGTWATAVTAPSAANNTGITIQATHVMNITSGIVSADQLIMNGSLTVGGGGSFTLSNGTGTDLTINTGVLTVNGTINWSNQATIINNGTAANILFNGGSNVNYNYTTGTGGVASALPAATFNVASNLNFNSISGTLTFPASWNATFGNVSFNTSGSAIPTFQGTITNIAGNLTLNGTAQLWLSTDENYTLTIGGSLSVLGTSRIVFSQSSTAIVNIGGDWLLESTRTSPGGSYLTYTGNTTLNLTGDFTMEAGVGILRFAGGANGIGIMNLNGNFSLISGTVNENGSGNAQGTLNFIRTGTQEFINTGAINNRINYYVGAGTTLDLGTYPASSGTGSLFTVDGTVIVRSLDPDGAVANNTINGNIRVPIAGRVWNPGSQLIYAGTGPQFMQAGHPTSGNVTTIINNPSSISLVSAVTVGGPLVLQSGNLNLNDNALTVQNTITYGAGLLAGSAGSSIIISGTLDGDAGALNFTPGSNTLGTLTINRAGTGVNLNVNSPLNLVTALNLITGTITNNSTISVAQGLTVTKYETSSLLGARLTANAGETYNLYYTTATSPNNVSPSNEFPVDQSHVGNVTIDLNSNGQDVFVFNNNLTVNGIFTLTRGRMSMGTFNMTMNGPTYNDDAGGMVASTGTLFFAGNTVVTGTGDPVFLAPVVVNAGATVNFQRNFNVQRNLTIQPGATWNMNGFTVLFSTPTPQIVSANGATFSNINVNKGGSSLTLISPLNLAGGLVFTGGNNTNFASNGFLILLSSSDQEGATQGYIYQLNGTNRVTGNVVVNRFIAGEGRIYRYIGSPVVTTVADLKDDMLVQGNFSDPSPTTTICGFTNTSSTRSLFYYNEAVTGTSGIGYVAYPLPGTTTAASPLVPGRGYATWVRTCSTAVALDYTGVINAGPISPPLTFTNTGDVAADGWNLVSNPYPCAIDWDLITTRTGLANAFAITDNGTVPSTTRYYDPDFANVDPELLDGQIAIGQGFWVYANGSVAPTITFNEAAKVTSTPSYMRSRSVPGFILALSNGAMEDRAYVKAVDGAKPEFDKFDLPKIPNQEGVLSLGILAGENEIAINAVDEVTCGSIFQLRTTGIQPGSYKLSIDSRGNFADYRFILVDKITKNEVVLSDDAYNFTLDENNLQPERFSIRVEENKTFTSVNVLSADACSAEAQINVESTQRDVSYSVWNSEGKQLSDLIPGSGSAMTLNLNADQLISGSNDLVIKASSECQSPVAVSTFNLVKGVPSIRSIVSNFACKSGAVQLVATADTDAVTYNWYETENAVTPIATGPVFETPVLNKNKTYFVEAISSITSCASARKPVTTDITVFTPPTLNVEGSKLVSSYKEGNQWYYEGLLLNKQNAQTLKMSKTGMYQLVVDFKGCSFTFNHELTDSGLNGIEVYPNPTSNILTVSRIPKDVDAIVLTNALGHNLGTVYTKDQVFDGQVSVSSVPDGVYLLIVTRGAEKSTHRFIKQTK
jgi:hypothetical protein